MRIAMLQSDLPPARPGGVGRQVDLLATALVRRGHDVTVYATVEGPTRALYRCERVPLPHSGRLYRQFGVGHAYGRLDLARFDVVHAHGDDWLLGRRPRVRTFYGTAAMEARRATSWLRAASQLCYYPLELVSSAGARGVTISRSTQRYLPLAREHVPCAFDPSVFHPGGARTPYPSVLFVAGTLHGRKRGDLLLRSFAEVRARLPAAQLTVVCPEAVEAAGVTGVSGLSPEALGALYRSHWILCSTSSYEGFGVPYVEALASGLPVVTTTNAGAREVLDGGRLGVLTSPETLVASMVALLSDESRRAQLAASGLEAAARYSIDAIVDEYERIYEELLEGAGRDGRRRRASR
jgi:phosphatidylinositol alpha-mannosyltransferase